MTAAEQRLKQEASAAFSERWQFVADMNGDGAVTISDVGLWLKWVFFAPGDALLLAFMQGLPGAALFLELNPRSVSGLLSGIISAGVWYLPIGILRETIRDARKNPRGPA
jgi:hypothetical protein